MQNAAQGERRAGSTRHATPRDWRQAMGASASPGAADMAAANRQISDGKIKLYIYDTGNSSPTVVAQLAEAKAHRIPVVAVSAALPAAGATFQQWQAAEVMAVAQALSATRAR